MIAALPRWELYGVLRKRRLLRRLPAIERLPRRDQQALLRTVDRFLDSFRPQQW